ncbi:MAG: aminodeoxychorismate lyase [Halieaceae bacterium]
MPDALATWIDGCRADSLPLPDRGLDYGDGLFETLLAVNGRIPLRDLHFDRLRSGLAALHFPPLNDTVARHLDAALATLDAKGNYSIRVTVTRGSAPRGYAPPADPEARIVLSAQPMAYDPMTMQRPARVGVSKVSWGKQPALAGVKHLNRLEQVLAARERDVADWDEALMLDQAGALISVTAGNLFLLSGATLLTPVLEDCGIAGTRRRFLIERAADLGLNVRETSLSLDDLKAADEAFYCNSLIGLRSIGEFGGLQWPKQPVCTQLFDHYCKELAA